MTSIHLNNIYSRKVKKDTVATVVHPRGYHNSNHLRNPLLLYGGSEFKIIKG